MRETKSSAKASNERLGEFVDGDPGQEASSNLIAVAWGTHEVFARGRWATGGKRPGG